jgi:hypothetical protein
VNPEDQVKNLEALTQKFQAQDSEITEESLQDYLEEVSQSLNQVFELVQVEIDRGMEKIEEAKDCLIEEGLEKDAETVGGVINHVSFAKRQLEIGQEVAKQKRDLELCPTDLEPERLLTPKVLEKFRQIEEDIFRTQ